MSPRLSPRRRPNGERPPRPRQSTSSEPKTNRQNAQFSTGPRTELGKLASSRNSTKHGLSTGQIIIPGENPAEFEALLADLLADHQPANASEELLVKEMAQSHWLTQRAIRLQNDCFTADGIDAKQLALFLRYQTTHQRAFHKALAALLAAQKTRRKERKEQIGFVSQNRPTQPPTAAVWRQPPFPENVAGNEHVPSLHMSVGPLFAVDFNSPSK
jgi:hypothetical protein